VTLAKAGVQARPLSLLRTACTVKAWLLSLRWWGRSNSRPASAAVKVQAGLPKLQLAAFKAAGVLLATPSTAGVVVVTCTLTVVLPLPDGMLKAVPAGQATEPPVAPRVPVTPPV
jgi:hypothetical protein